MKRIFLLFSILSVFFLIGCGKYSDNDAIRDLNKKIGNAKGYYLEGQMEIINNDDTFKYDVTVSFERQNQYRVSLRNTANNHEQIILKNKDGVYVLTPSLNKSFKFQSEWPYNNSQVYLLQSLLRDIKEDSERTFEEKDNHYVFRTRVNYPNNRRLLNQVIYLDKDLNFKEAHVLDNNNNPQIKMKFSSIDMKATFDKNYFTLEENIKNNKTVGGDKEVTAIHDIIYPLYIPNNTHLASQDKIAKDNGERVILTFAGEKPFMLIEETVSLEEEMQIIPTFGDPILINDTIGALSDSSVNWISHGIEYYLVSSVLDRSELLEIAQSIGVLPVGK